MEIEYEIKFPYFLSKYSYITNNLEKELNNHYLEKELNNHSNISELNSQNENLSSLNNDSKINKENEEEDTHLIIRSSRENNNYQNSYFYKN